MANDFILWWAKLRGKPNPLLRIGEMDHGNRDGETIWALKDISFTVKQGEVLGIIGRNGAGKSTLLKILSRVTAPTQGRIRVKGRVASLLEVGTGFHPELTGRENIYLNGAILGMNRKEIDRKFDEIVDFAEVEKFIDTPVKRYSSGMYVRLAFSVAAHLEPEILLVDEVLAVGDAQFQKKCLGKMGEVARKGRTVLFVSHNMASVVQLCSTSILLNNGLLDCVGDVDACITKYLDNDQTKADNVISYGKSLTDTIKVFSVKVNGADSRNMTLFSDTRELNIVIDGCLNERSRISLEARLVDSNGAPLAHYSPAHFDASYNKSENRCLGSFVLSGVIRLPSFTKGDYFLDIYLTDPGVRGLWECRHGVHITTESIPMATGHTVLEYKKGHGAFILGGKFELRNNHGGENGTDPEILE